MIFKNVKKGVSAQFSGEGGFGSSIAHRAWIFPSKVHDQAKNNEELTNAYAFLMSHEIGHTLGLAHPQGRGTFSQYGERNIMNSVPELRNVFSFNFEIHSNQVQQIKEYLGQGAK